MKFTNIENFERWLRSVLNDRCLELFGFDAWLADVEKRHCETGSTTYEVGGRYTRTGKPALYDFKVNYIEVDEDEWETEIIF